MSYKWQNLGEMFHSLAKNFIVKRTINLILLIIKEEKSEDLLQEINNNLKKLIQKHYNVGLRYFEEMQKSKNKKLQIRLLHDARQAFSEAATVDSPLQAARAIRLVGVCYDMIGEKETALIRYEEAYEKARQYHNRLAEIFETSISAFMFDLLLGVSLVGQPLMYGRWTYRYAKRKRKEVEVREVQEFLSELQQFLYKRDLYLESFNKEIKGIPHYTWSDI